MVRFTALAATLFVLAGGLASAKDYKVGDLEIDNPWSRGVPKGAQVAAAYLTIKNNGQTADRLVGGSTPVAGKFELHEMTMDNGVMRMRPLAAGLEIKPGETVEFKPESFHIMLMGLKQPIEQGKTFPATLMFEKAGKVDVEFAIQAMGATRAPEPSHAHH
jgi:periplasmic copper chaperone A